MASKGMEGQDGKRMVVVSEVETHIHPNVLVENLHLQLAEPLLLHRGATLSHRKAPYSRVVLVLVPTSKVWLSAPNLRWVV